MKHKKNRRSPADIPEQFKMWASVGMAAAMIYNGQANSMELTGGIQVGLIDGRIRIDIPLAAFGGDCSHPTVEGNLQVN